MENKKIQAATWNKHSIAFNDLLFNLQYISKAKYREIQKKIKVLAKVNDTEAAQEYMFEVYNLYRRLSKQRELKSEICKKIDTRLDNKKVALTIKADRLMLLAKEAYLSGLLPQEDFNFLKRSLIWGRGGKALSDQEVYCFINSIYQDLKSNHPFYKGLAKSETRIKVLLSSLNHYKPILP